MHPKAYLLFAEEEVPPRRVVITLHVVTKSAAELSERKRSRMGMGDTNRRTF